MAPHPRSGPAASTRSARSRCQLSTATLLRFSTLEGDDKIDVSGAAAPVDASLPTELRTGDGTDTLTGGPLVDTVFAGAGDDRLAGGGAADQLHGEGGDDVFTGLDDADLVDGGPGGDLLDLSAVATGMRISLDGAANDGVLGATASVAVENVRGTATTDQLVGGDGRNELLGEGGDDLIVVRGGGADVVDCGPGTDRVEADVSDFVTSCEFVDRDAPRPAARRRACRRRSSTRTATASWPPPTATTRAPRCGRARWTCPATGSTRTARAATPPSRSSRRRSPSGSWASGTARWSRP